MSYNLFDCLSKISKDITKISYPSCGLNKDYFSIVHKKANNSSEIQMFYLEHEENSMQTIITLILFEYLILKNVISNNFIQYFWKHPLSTFIWFPEQIGSIFKSLYLLSLWLPSYPINPLKKTWCGTYPSLGLDHPQR